jgi:Xaa-Pro dipeptidase
VTGPAPLMDRGRLDEIRRLLPEVGADAWLLYDFRDQNPLAHSLLGLGKTTRRAFALFPLEGEPRLLHHAIESSAWRGWPWERRSYSGWRELAVALASLLEGTGTVAMESSPMGQVPTVDRVPMGVVEMVREAGATVVSSGDLVSHFHSRWTPRGLELHRKASEVVRETAHAAFARAAEAAHGGDPVREGALMEWIRDRLRAGGLTDQEDCIVAVETNAADPHYHPAGNGSLLVPDSLVLIDLWGRHPDEGIAADQTWMAFLGEAPSGRMVEVWEVVRDARDRALDFLFERGRTGVAVRGWEADQVARDLMAERGFEEYFVHRLGHSIDRELHGSGPNLDHLETRDERLLLPGVGFSVEPGVYIPGEIGVRSEVNVHWSESGPEVTTPEPQRDLLLFPAG